MRKKGALFYIIDAFVAASIIALTLSIILVSGINKPQSEETYTILDKYLTFLEETHVANLPGETAKELYLNDELFTREATVMQAAIELYERNEIVTATSLIHEATTRSLPIQFGVNISVIEEGGTTRIYQRKAERAQASRSQLVHRRTISYLQDEQEDTYTATLTGGQTGIDACSPNDCLYVAEPTIPRYEHDQDCGNNNNGWTAYCREYNESEWMTGIIEVSIWS